MRWTVVFVVLLALVLVPFVLFEARFNALAADLTSPDAPRWYVATAIAGLLASDVFLPIPSSIVSAVAGALLGFWNGTVAIWAGMGVACLSGYWFGAQASAAARRFVGDAGMARAASLAARYGDYAIVLCRPIPVLAEASVIFAGVVRRPFRRFLLLAGSSNLGIAVGYAAIGAFSMRIDAFLLAFLAGVAVPAITLLAGRIWLQGR
jgi:uncharacterized membrane protein YdjX (TVP38/TMEM64 family)